MHQIFQERLVRRDEVQRLTGLARATLYKRIAAGDFPKPVKLGRASAWPETEVAAYIEERKAERDAA